jgi:FK506-binding protein 1
MGVEKIINSEGNGTDFPKKGEYVTMDYTGWLFDESAPGNKGGTPYVQQPSSYPVSLLH